MIVVTGATGNVGRPLVRALVSAGEDVTAVARGNAARELPAGARWQRADLAEPETLRPALDGATAVFLLTSADFLAGGDLDPVLKIARAAGVERVVLLSSLGVGTGRHPAELEDAVRRSGLAWTMLRPAGFHTNAFAWAGTVRAERMIAAPFGNVALPHVDPADIAEVAAAALRAAGHDGLTYELTGPAPVSPRLQAAAIGAALGEPVRFVELSRAQARAQLVRFQPAPIADSTLDILGSPVAAEQRVSPDVERITGHPARAFADWAVRNADVFR